MRIYLDSSALVKRVALEPEHDALEQALAAAVADGHLLVSSALARVEVSRALRSLLDAEHPARLARAARDAFDGVAIAPLTGPMLESARTIGPPVLRTLDAIHLAAASAVEAGELWTYDDRLAAASEATGIVRLAPGSDAA